MAAMKRLSLVRAKLYECLEVSDPENFKFSLSELEEELKEALAICQELNYFLDTNQ